jgi:hypothetical protein
MSVAERRQAMVVRASGNMLQRMRPITATTTQPTILSIRSISKSSYKSGIVKIGSTAGNVIAHCGPAGFKVLPIKSMKPEETGTHLDGWVVINSVPPEEQKNCCCAATVNGCKLLVHRNEQRK